MAINKTKVATEIGAALLQPSLDIAGKELANWFIKKDPIQRGADLIGNIGEVARTRTLGGLTDEVTAPSMNIEEYKKEHFDSGKFNYGKYKGNPAARKRDGFDDSYFRSQEKSPGTWADIAFTEPDTGMMGGAGPEVIEGREFNVTQPYSGYDTEQATVLTPNTFASNLGINDLERAKYVSEIAGYGATTAALGAAALGVNALMRGSKPRSAYASAVQDSGGYNPNVEASRASYEYSAKLEMLKQENRERNERARQQAFKPGVQQYGAPPMGGYGQYPNMPDSMQMVNSLLSAQTPVYG
jgi:hypothetical protein